MQRIYFDHAATTPTDPRVWHAVQEIQPKAWGNPSSIHADGRYTRTIIEDARRTVAEYLKASLGEVFFTSGGTESHNQVLYHAYRDLGIRRIISSPVEHPCILQPLHVLAGQYTDLTISYLGVNSFGQPDLTELEALLSESSVPTLVSLMHVNNEVGVITDIQQVGDLCRQYGALFHCDTVQGIGFESYNLQELPVDFLAGSAHKFYGLKGAGFLYVRDDHQIQPLLRGGSQERNMRAGTENILGIHALAKALQLAQAESESRRAALQAIHDQLRTGLASLQAGLTFNGEAPNSHSPKILSVNFPAGPRSEMLLLHLDIAGISASGGSACSSGVESASPVLQHLQIPEDQKTVRFSFSPWNTEEEVTRVLEVVQELLD